MGHKYVKENETFDTSRNGTVPKPTQADVTNNKILQADGSWVPQSGGGGGSSTLAGLSDVDLSSPSDSQILQYDDSSSKWINADPPASSSSIETLTDVDLDNLSDGQMLQYDDSSSKWVNVDPPSGGGDVTDVEVNGTSVVDENGVAEIVSYKEVTQAEYNALPDTKLSDGVLYCIKDAPSSPEGFPPLIYSFEEREIGVWADGKPLYQKTVSFTTGASGGYRTYSTGLTNIESALIDYDNSYYVNNRSKIQATPYASAVDTMQFAVFASVNASNEIGLDYRVGDSAQSKSAIVTLQYTKTTDVAGSGTWTTQGALAHHYSTTEHIIGTWIDGKPIYEKTYNNVSVPVGSNTSRHYTDVTVLSGLNIDKMIRIDGMWIDDTNWKPLGCADNYSFQLVYNTTGNKITALTTNVTDTKTIFYTIQYTKTTD